MFTRARYRLQEPLGNTVSVLGRRTIALDAFTRADSAVSLGTADIGGAWTANVGTWGISSNKAYCPTPDGVATQVATLSTGVPNATVSATFTGTGIGTGTAMPWLIFRFVDTSNYLLVSAQSATTIEIFKKIAGSFTQIGTAAHVWASGQRVMVTFNGSSIVTFVDGVQRATASDSALSTATRHGIGGTTTLDASVRFDDFLVTAP